jgi:membrane associated rhomboid family serine protease
VLTLPAVLVLGEWIVLQVISALGALRIIGEDTANIAYFAHLGGFGTGLVLAGGAKTITRVRHAGSPRMTRASADGTA